MSGAPVVLFPMLRRQWTPCLYSHELAAKPVGVTVANTSIALFRDDTGRAHALVDRCPHRGAALSHGRVVGKNLECPFHGWQYAGGGACAFVPLSGLTDEQRSHVRAPSLALHEAGGLVFVFTEEDSRDVPSPPRIPEELTRSSVHVARHSEVWHTHWSRAMENMLDAPHLPFVHRKTIGRALRRRMTPTSVMDIDVAASPNGFRTESTIDGEDSGAWLDWNRPNGMVLNIPIPGKTFRQHVYCVPIDEEHTRMMLMTTRDFAVHNPVARLGDLFSLRVMAEDRRVIETIRPMEVPPLEQTHSARTDAATLEFRKWYWARKKNVERAGSAE